MYGSIVTEAACCRGAGARALAEHEQVGQRVAAQPVRAVHPARDLARREQAGHARRARVGVDADAAHHVVRRRPDLHRPRRDVDVGELLELLVHRGQLAPDVIGRQVADVEEHPAVRRAPTLADLGVDRPRDVVPRRQLGRPAGVGLAGGAQGLDPGPGLLVGRRVLVAAVLREVVPHESLAILVAQDPALAANRLGHEEAADAGRPDHPGRVELDELHVDQLGAGAERQRLAVARVLPRVRGDLVGLADATGRQEDRLGREDDRPAVARR